ncbi:hypothetical protein EDF82_3228 [Raoultella sp. BIGb0399]|nr:hypothetical protein EDF82_3228 [Raoultella sp. BIGb0399]
MFYGPSLQSGEGTRSHNCDADLNPYALTAIIRTNKQSPIQTLPRRA